MFPDNIDFEVEQKRKQKYKNLGRLFMTLAIITVVVGIIILIATISNKPGKTSCPSMGDDGWFECESKKDSDSFGFTGKIIATIFVSIPLAVIFFAIAMANFSSANSVITSPEELAAIKARLPQPGDHESIIDTVKHHIYDAKPKVNKICQNCGGTMKYKKGKVVCPYCGDNN